mgnify:CR=1 FL=1
MTPLIRALVTVFAVATQIPQSAPLTRVSADIPSVLESVNRVIWISAAEGDEPGRCAGALPDLRVAGDVRAACAQDRRAHE